MTQPDKFPFTFVTLTGSSYEIGRQQGEAIRRVPGWAAFFASTPAEWTARYLEDLMQLYREFCPGITDEIQGLADGMGIRPEQVVYHSVTYLIPPRCSHVAILPRWTKTGHTLVGRSYEFGVENNDNRLCLTRAAGRYAHIGNSSILLGRLDGMNEHGLTVTMSAGGIPVSNLPGLLPPEEKGLQFWAAVRSVLENCRTVAEGLELIQRFPFCGNPILILADAQGNAAKVEIFGSHRVVWQLDEASEPGFLCGTNHFTHPNMQKYHGQPMKNSVQRYALIEDFINSASGKFDQADLVKLLSSHYPEGLCCHYYKEYFGTLHSMIMNPMDRTLSICFGSPLVNPWHRFDFQTNIPHQTFEMKLPQAEGFDQFWG